MSYRRLVALLFFLCLTPFTVQAAQDQDAVVAMAGDIPVHEGYLTSLKEYYASGGFTSERDQYIKQAVRFKILAAEAAKEGLEPAELNLESWDYDLESGYNKQLIEDIGLAEAYMARAIAEYPVDSVVIDSYYRSKPGHFKEGPWNDAELVPLDDELRAGIKARILEMVRSRIIDKIYKDIKKDYEIQIFN